MTQGKEPARGDVESVEMADGTVVNFAGKRKLIKEVVTEGKHPGVNFYFRNGESRHFQIPHEMLADFAAHGASQKIGDETAGLDDVEDMVVAVDDIISRLERGEWAARRATGDGFSGASVVIRAICEVTGKSVSDVKEFLQSKLDKAEASGHKLTRNMLYASFRNPETKTGSIIARLEQEKMKKDSGVSAADLLAELA